MQSYTPSNISEVATDVYHGGEQLDTVDRFGVFGELFVVFFFFFFFLR